jgi:hypothetical protein
MKAHRLKYTAATGEVFFTDAAGIDYLHRMVEHVRGQYQQVDRLRVALSDAEKKIAELQVNQALRGT